MVFQGKVWIKDHIFKWIVGVNNFLVSTGLQFFSAHFGKRERKGKFRILMRNVKLQCKWNLMTLWVHYTLLNEQLSSKKYRNEEKSRLYSPF